MSEQTSASDPHAGSRDTPVGRRLEPMARPDCLRALADRYLGRLAFARDGVPDVVPMNYRLHDGTVVLRAAYGTVLDAVVGTPIAFEVDAVDPAYHAGWSVVVHGVLESVTEPGDLQALEQLPLRPWAPGDRPLYLRIPTDVVTGRRIA